MAAPGCTVSTSDTAKPPVTVSCMPAGTDTKPDPDPDSVTAPTIVPPVKSTADCNVTADDAFIRPRLTSFE